MLVIDIAKTLSKAYLLNIANRTLIGLGRLAINTSSLLSTKRIEQDCIKSRKTGFGFETEISIECKIYQV